MTEFNNYFDNEAANWFLELKSNINNLITFTLKKFKLKLQTVFLHSKIDSDNKPESSSLEAWFQYQ